MASVHANAAAQQRTALIAPSGPDRQLAAQVERVIRTRMGELDVGGELESSPLAWADLELAAGCMGEDAECYASVAAQLEVDELVLANAESTSDEAIVELVRWRASGVSRRLLRQSGRSARLQILDGVGPALRELYELPPAPVVVHTPVTAARGGVDLLGPVILGATSLAVLGVAIGLGVASDGSRAEWRTGPTATADDVDRTLAARQRAETEIIAADVLFVTAAALGVSAAIWLILELTGGDADGDVARGFSTGWAL